jgi:Ca-activated chloride channel family protein
VYTIRFRSIVPPRRQPPTPGLWFCFRLLPVLTVYLLGCLLLSASVARAAGDHAPGAAAERALEIRAGGQRIVDEVSARAQVLTLALAHQAPSPYTSFVAVEQRRSRPQDDSLRPVVVPASGPWGLHPQAFAYPQTATTAGAKLFLGCFLLFIALFFWVMRGPEVDHVPDQRS